MFIQPPVCWDSRISEMFPLPLKHINSVRCDLCVVCFPFRALESAKLREGAATSPSSTSWQLCGCLYCWQGLCACNCNYDWSGSLCTSRGVAQEHNIVPKDAGSVLAAGAVFLVEAKNEISCVSRFGLSVKIFRWSKLIRGPSLPRCSFGM